MQGLGSVLKHKNHGCFVDHMLFILKSICMVSKNLEKVGEMF